MGHAVESFDSDPGFGCPSLHFATAQVGAEELTYGLPVDDHHRHFGGGQTQVAIDLPPGDHTLQLVLGDHSHVPHATPIMSEVITITVE